MSDNQINRKAPGVYKIYCSGNDKSYIGQSLNIGKRLVRHKSDLNKGKHPNDVLQASWNKYGSDSFSFLPIENCPSEILTEREIFYVLDIPTDKRFNLAAITDSVKISESSLNKMRGRKSPRKGVTLSLETKNNISNSLKNNEIEMERAKKNCELMNSDPSIIKKRTESRKKNYIVSEETKKLLSYRTKEYWNKRRSLNIVN